MKKSFFIILFALFHFCYGQKGTHIVIRPTQSNIHHYDGKLYWYTFPAERVQYSEENIHLELANYLQNIKKDTNSYNSYYYLAVIYNQLEKQDSAAYWLFQYYESPASKYNRTPVLLFDPQFDKLRQNKMYWEPIQNKMEEDYAKTLPASANKALAFKYFNLWLISLKMTDKDSYFSKYSNADIVNQLLPLIQENGFPTYSTCGLEACMLMANFDCFLTKKGINVLENVKNAFEKGDFPPRIYAYVIDNNLMRNKNPKQEYGTIYYRNKKRENVLARSVSVEQMNENRKKIGIDKSVEEDAISLGVKFIIPDDVKTIMTTKQIKGAEKHFCFIPQGAICINCMVTMFAYQESKPLIGYAENKTVLVPYFFMSPTEVSNKEYLMFLDDLKQQGRTEDYNTAAIVNILQFDSLYLKEEYLRTLYAEYPVRNISYEGAQLYCKWLTSKLEDQNWEYRLPTKEEWIYAAKGRKVNSEYPWGDPYLTNL